MPKICWFHVNTGQFFMPVWLLVRQRQFGKLWWLIFSLVCDIFLTQALINWKNNWQINRHRQLLLVASLLFFSYNITSLYLLLSRNVLIMTQNQTQQSTASYYKGILTYILRIFEYVPHCYYMTNDAIRKFCYDVMVLYYVDGLFCCFYADISFHLICLCVTKSYRFQLYQSDSKDDDSICNKRKKNSQQYFLLKNITETKQVSHSDIIASCYNIEIVN